MAMTEFGLNHDLAVKRWSQKLAIEAEVKQYFRKFMGTGPTSLIVIKNELNKAAGDKVTVGLRMKLAGDGIEGDNIIEGSSAEEALVFYADSLFIDQRRKSTKSKGKMSEQRVPYDMRKEGMDALSTWFAEDFDQQIMMYLAGARGVDTTFHVPLTFTGRANNSLTAPDAAHIIFGGAATAKGDLDANDKVSLGIVERLLAKAETTDPMMQPFSINGENKFVLLLHTFMAYDLRVSTSTNDWMDIHKATDNQSSPIYKNALGEYAGVILHKHRNVIRFSDYGAGSNVAAGRALFLASQAGMIAWGQGGGPGRYSWNEDKDDRGNALAITGGTIYGVKKSRYNSKDFGVIAVDAACADPNA